MLTIEGVTKRFGERRVLDDVGFDVGRGRLTGFVGGNGAGKTTTMRILLGVLEPDAGTVSIDGSAIGPADRKRFGYMPEERGLYPKMRVAEQITYLARLHGVGKREAADRTGQLLERLELGKHADDEVEKLSLGNQQRGCRSPPHWRTTRGARPGRALLGPRPDGRGRRARRPARSSGPGRAGAVLEPPARRRRAPVRRRRRHRRRADPGVRAAGGPPEAGRATAWELLVDGDVAWLRDERASASASSTAGTPCSRRPTRSPSPSCSVRCRPAPSVRSPRVPG